MPSEWTSQQVDNRTFGDQWSRVLDDLNKPDFLVQAQQYLQDAMRFFSRRPFFFNDFDNTNVPVWAPSTIYTQGATIQASVGGTIYSFVAMNQGTSGLVAPTWPTTLFVAPTTGFPPPPVGTAGTVIENGGPPTGILWANTGPFQLGMTTGFTTVYQINQYILPIDLIMLRRVEVTWAGNLRIGMVEIPYDELRDYDVIRPFSPATYPAWFAWYQQQLYFWPYPVAQFPITLSYRGAPPIPVKATDSNIWTTQAEACIRYHAEGRLYKLLIHDEVAAQDCFQMAEEEYRQLVTQGAEQTKIQGIVPSEW